MGWGEHTLEKLQQQHIMLYCRIMFQMKHDVFPSTTYLGLQSYINLDFSGNFFIEYCNKHEGTCLEDISELRGTFSMVANIDSRIGNTQVYISEISIGD